MVQASLTIEEGMNEDKSVLKRQKGTQGKEFPPKRPSRFAWKGLQR